MGLGLVTYLHYYIPLFLYLGSIIVAFISAFRSPKIGILYIICTIPFTYSLIKAQQYPLGNQLLDIIFFSIFLGILQLDKIVQKSKSFTPIILLISIYFIALLNGFLAIDINTHIEHMDRIRQWKNFMMMPILYFFTFYCIREEKVSRQIIFLTLLVLLIVEWKFFNSSRWLIARDHFSYQVRGGQFGYLGANEFAAFILNYLAFGIGVLFFSSISFKFKSFLILTVCFGVFCILYSYSRGAYLGLVIVILFFSIFDKKIRIGIILIAIVGILGTQLLPQSITERITMTQTEEGEIENSAGGRLYLWTHVLNNIFPKRPIIGVGYGMFRYVPAKNAEAFGDPHNNYMETLAEQGIVGVIILLFLYYSAWRSGWLLYKFSFKANDRTIRGIGMGFCGCTIASMTTNIFGDRWTHYQIMTYFWMLWAIVDRIYLIRTTNHKEISLSNCP